MFSWSNISLFFCAGILLLRLIIGQFLPDFEPSIKEGFSNIIITFLIFTISLPFLFKQLFKSKYPSDLEIPILIFLVGTIISLSSSSDFPSAFQSVLILGGEITFFLMLRALLDSPQKIRSLLIFLLLLTGIVTIFGIYTFLMFWMRPTVPEDLSLQYTNKSLYYLITHPRAISFFGWPNTLAGYLLLFFPLMIVLPFHLKERWQKFAGGALLFLSSVCFLYTFSFLGWTALLFSVVINYQFLWKNLEFKNWPQKKKRLLWYGLFLFLILFLIVIGRKDFLSSLAPRLVYYKIAFELLLKNCLWGYGLGSFGIISSPLMQERSLLSVYVHNTYLQIWLETGIIGFLGFIFLTGKVFLKVKSLIQSFDLRKSPIILVAIGWGLIAFLIDNIFSFTFLKSSVALFAWAMLAVFYAWIGQDKDLFKVSMIQLVGQRFLCLILLIMFFFTVRLMGGYLLYGQAQAKVKEGIYKDAVELLEKAKSIDPWSSYLSSADGDLRLKAYADTQAITYLKEGEIQYLDAMRKSPKVYANYYMLGLINVKLGDLDRWADFRKSAQRLSPSEFQEDVKHEIK